MAGWGLIVVSEVKVEGDDGRGGDGDIERDMIGFSCDRLGIHS